MSDRLADWIASDSPYRPAYVTPGLRKDTGRPKPDPWTLPEFRALFPCAQLSRHECALKWLEMEFGRR